MLFSLSANIAFAEGELSFKTPAKLHDAVAGSSYTATIEAQGGTPPYTYTINPGAGLPEGLSFNNGKITGTPTQGGTMFCDIEITVTDAANNSISQKFIMTVEAIPVVFEITNNVYTFDGLPHKATIVTLVNGDPTTDIDYTVTYGGAEEQTASGMYPIEITINTPGYAENFKTADHLLINQNEDIRINFSTSSYVYNGSPQGPTAEVEGKYTKVNTDPIEYEWKPLQHTLVYEGLNVTYDKVAGTAPTLPGRYFVSCRIDEQGFVQYPPNNTAEFEISKAKVNFNLQNQTFPYNQGDEWTGVYAPTVDGVAADVKYVKDGVEYNTPQSAGDYTVSITLSEEDDVKYEVGDITPPSFSVGKQTVTFTATKKSEVYNDVDYSAEVTNDAGLTEGTDYEVVYYNSEGEQVTPHDADTYTFDINFLNGKGDLYAKADITDNTFEITPKPIKFTINPLTYNYQEGVDQSPTVKVEPEIDAGMYKVQYKNKTTEALSDTVHDIADYEVVITFTEAAKNNYKIATGSTKSIHVAMDTLDFELENTTQVYDGQPKTVTPITNADKITKIIYSQDHQEVEFPTNVGVYHIEIDPHDGYGVGNITPSEQQLVITARPVTFTADNTTTTYTFDGKAHQATVTTTDTVIKPSEYKIQYRDSKGALSDSVTKSGSYDIVVTLTNPNNKNYTITSPTDKLVINENIRMALGNSPAAMIFKDSRYSDTSVEANVEWRENTFNALKNNRKFSGDNVPLNCTADIVYSKAEGIVDFDIDEYTVIVNNIKDYTDPGFMVDDKVPYKGTPVEVEGVDNLYTVTYEYNDETYTRYVVVTSRIGDINGDGSVNAVDANNLDKVNITSPATITQARVWDVNKDGKIDQGDADAIRKRFKTKLTPFYSWVQ